MTNTSASPIPAPRRSRRRWYVLAGFVLLLIATPVGYYFCARWSLERELQAIYREMDADDPNWRWHDVLAELQAVPPLADEENAALQLTKVQLLLQNTPFKPGPKWTKAMQKLRRYPNARWTEEQAGALRAAFSSLAPAVLEEARKLKDLPAGRFAIVSVDNPMDLPEASNLMKSLGLMELLRHDAILRAHDRDMEGAADSCVALLHASRSHNRYPTIMVYLVHAWGRLSAVEALETALAQGEVSVDKIRQLQQVLELEAADDGMYRCQRGERASGHQMYLLLRDGTISFSKVFEGGHRLAETFPNLVLNRYPEYLRSCNAVLQATKLPEHVREDAVNKLGGGKRGYLGMRLWSTDEPLFFFKNVNEQSQSAQAKMRCALIALAAERYRREHGRWPDGADALVKDGMLRATYQDPYDGQPIRWRRTDWGIMIYSIGPDKIDNSGTLNRLHGADVGFELWNPALRHV